jgi:hypothetical protein
VAELAGGEAVKLNIKPDPAISKSVRDKADQAVFIYNQWSCGPTKYRKSGVAVSIEIRDGQALMLDGKPCFGAFLWPDLKGEKNLIVRVAGAPIESIDHDEWLWAFAETLLHELFHAEQYLDGKNPSERSANSKVKKCIEFWRKNLVSANTNKHSAQSFVIQNDRRGTGDSK